MSLTMAPITVADVMLSPQKNLRIAPARTQNGHYLQIDR